MELVNELYAFCNRSESTRVGRTIDDPAMIGVAERPATLAVLKEAVEALILMISPFAPHMAEELWQGMGHKDGVVAAGWPAFDERVSRADQIVVPVQVNGKVRARLTVSVDVSEDELKSLALADPHVTKNLDGRTVRKVVVAGGAGSRIVSIVAS
jgi:leucyl-tRNA synthetase